MRVIAGKARSLPLKTIETMETRPTTDRIKETLFNLLSADIPGCRFLDLFAGSGGIGIEALSRGAVSCAFVEKNPQAVRCIQENLRFTHLDAQAQVLAMDVFQAIRRLETSGQAMDLIFMDPPYRNEWEKKVLEMLKDSCLANEETLIIVEASLDTDLSDYPEEYGFEITREKIYKTNKHVFLRRKQKTEEV